MGANSIYLDPHHPAPSHTLTNPCKKATHKFSHLLKVMTRWIIEGYTMPLKQGTSCPVHPLSLHRPSVAQLFQSKTNCPLLFHLLQEWFFSMVPVLQFLDYNYKNSFALRGHGRWFYKVFGNFHDKVGMKVYMAPRTNNIAFRKEEVSISGWKGILCLFILKYSLCWRPTPTIPHLLKTIGTNHGITSSPHSFPLHNSTQSTLNGVFGMILVMKGRSQTLLSRNTSQVPTLTTHHHFDLCLLWRSKTMVMEWELSCGMMMWQIGQQVDYAFSQPDLGAQTMYWIGTVGPLWVYRKKDDNG